jgi:hypothetical protein
MRRIAFRWARAGDALFDSRNIIVWSVALQLFFLARRVLPFCRSSLVHCIPFIRSIASRRARCLKVYRRRFGPRV